MNERRLFVAIDVANEIIRNAEAIQQRLSRVMDGVEWTSPRKMHVTLKFLGPLDPDRHETAKSILRECAESHSPFRLEYSGIGQFPKKGTPRVLWVGCGGDDREELRSLHDCLDRGMTDVDVRRESRKYIPHLTIGRTRDAGNLDDYRPHLNAEQGAYLGVQTVTEVTLFQSELAPGGARYSELFTVSLETHDG